MFYRVDIDYKSNSNICTRFSTIDAERSRLKNKPETRAYDYADYNTYADASTMRILH